MDAEILKLIVGLIDSISPYHQTDNHKKHEL